MTIARKLPRGAPGRNASVHRHGGRDTPLKRRVARRRVLANVPADRVCAWEFHPVDPDAPKDTSATAIAAAALVKLAPLAGERYRAAAAETLAALRERHLGRHGGLMDGCYNVRKGLAPRHELIWADYFALEGALGLEEILPTATL